MIKKIIITGIAAAGLLLSAQASANQSHFTVKVWNSNAQSVSKYAKSYRRHVRKPRFNVNREQRQQAVMIKQGIRSCKITPREAKVLNKQQKQIKKTERRLRRHGLTRWEKNFLKTALKKSRVKINRLTKNQKTCGRGYRGYSKERRGSGHRH